MLRLLIKDITVEKPADQKQLLVHIRWQGGACSDISVQLPLNIADRVRRNRVAGGGRQSRLALLFFGLLAVQAQQELIQFANSLHTPLEFAIFLERLTNLRNLVRT